MCVVPQRTYLHEDIRRYGCQASYSTEQRSTCKAYQKSEKERGEGGARFSAKPVFTHKLVLSVLNVG
jgi:hypothetical protein